MKKKLIPLSLLAAMSLSGCWLVNQQQDTSSQGTTQEATTSQGVTTEEGTSSTEDTSAAVQYAVDFANMDELLAPWYLSEKTRTIRLDLSPRCNVADAIAEGLITITSDAPEIIAVNGTVLSALAVGEATITVTYGDSNVSLLLDVDGAYDPSTVTAIADIELEQGEDGKYIEATFTVAGVVTAPFSGGFFLDDGEAAIEVYDSTVTVERGAYILGTGVVAAYNSILEFKSFTVVQELDPQDAPVTTLQKDPIYIGPEWTEEDTKFNGFKAVTLWGTITTTVSGGTTYDAIYPEDNPESYLVEPSYYAGTLEQGKKVKLVGYGWDRTKYHYLGVYIDSFIDEPVTEFELTVSGDLFLNGTAKLGINPIAPADATALDTSFFTFETSNAGIIAVDEDGTLHGIGVGSATITAISKFDESVTAQVSIEVIDCGGPLGEFTMEPDLTIMAGFLGNVNYQLTDADPANPSLLNTVSLTSSDESVATVDEDGTVHAVSAGTATITGVTRNVGVDGQPLTATCEVTVVPVEQVISVTPFATEVEIVAKVTSLGFRGFSIDDGSAGIYVYNYDSKTRAAIVNVTVAAGDIVRVSGKGAKNAGCVQIIPTDIEILEGHDDITPSEIQALDPEMIPGHIEDAQTDYIPAQNRYSLQGVKCLGGGNYPTFQLGEYYIEGVNNSRFNNVVPGAIYNLNFYLSGFYTDSGKGITYLTVNLVDAVEGAYVTLEAESTTVAVGGTLQLEVVAHNFDDPYEREFDSSDEEVLTVDETGQVVGVAEGTATVTVTLDNEMTASIELTVVSGEQGDTATVTFTAGQQVGTKTGQGTYDDVISSEGVTVTGHSSPLGNLDNYRIYQSKSVTISMPETEGTITKIEFTCTANGTAKYGPGNFVVQDQVGTYTYDAAIGTWTGETNEVTFVASSAQVRITEIVVTYVPAAAVEPAGE